MQFPQIRRKGRQELPVDLVGHGDFDGREGIKNVEFSQVEGSVVVDRMGVFENDKIEPAYGTERSANSFGSQLCFLTYQCAVDDQW